MDPNPHLPALAADILGDWREEVIFRTQRTIQGIKNFLRLKNTILPIADPMMDHTSYATNTA